MEIMIFNIDYAFDNRNFNRNLVIDLSDSNQI